MNHVRRHARTNQTKSSVKPAQKGRTGIDGLFLRLHSNLTLPRDLHSEYDGLAHDGALSLTNDATGHAPLGSFFCAPHASRKRELHRARLADCPRETLAA